MLSNAWKRRQLRKAIKNKQLNPVPGNFSYRISTVGVLLELQEDNQIQMISNALEKHGILKSNMEFLILNDNKASVQNKSYKFYSLKSFNSMGHCLESQVLEFINKPFDLLVSLYEKNSIALQWATACSKAKCKTGLFYEQESLNHFDIKLNHLQGKEFVDLLFNYLAIFSENDKKTNNQKTITK